MKKKKLQWKSEYKSCRPSSTIYRSGGPNFQNVAIDDCIEFASFLPKRLLFQVKMITSLLTATLVLASAITASPIAPESQTPTLSVPVPTTTPVQKLHDWTNGWQTSFPIHESCNTTLRSQLQQGLDEAVLLAQHARNHLLRWGHLSRFTQRYFGNGSTALPVGWYDRIIAADKTEMLFRCDDPDRNCETQKSKPQTPMSPA